MINDIANLIKNLSEHNSSACGYELSKSEIQLILKLFDDAMQLEKYKSIGSTEECQKAIETINSLPQILEDLIEKGWDEEDLSMWEKDDQNFIHGMNYLADKLSEHLLETDKENPVSEDVKEKCCGSCKWHEQEEIDHGFVCVNGDSENVADWTENEDCCQEWEER